jgi:V/A-type H+-transporting ATPase subunit B
MRLSEHRYKTVTSIKGPLLFVENIFNVRMSEEVKIIAPDKRIIPGEVLMIDENMVLIQVLGNTGGLNTRDTTVIFSDSIKKAPLSEDIVGRIFDGSGRPIDGLPMFIPEKYAPITGYPINPSARQRPEKPIETGYSVIDGLNTLIKGQKLPIFSCAGLPSKELVAGILKNSTARIGEEGFVVVFVAIGLTFYEYFFYRENLEEIRINFVAFINRADDPVMERLLAPRFGLTVAEYLAFEKGMDVLVLITDMINYCEALREVSTSREELPGRRGYPGYMYSDLASLYERAGRIKNQPGSITIIPVVTMPEDDITHPIPDLTGYITEGQIVLSRELHQKGIFPPVDILPSLSRLMQRGIGEGRTRSDHREIANLLYKFYAKGRDLRRLEAIIGRDSLAEGDRKLLDFAERFEKEFVNQGSERRSINDTLNIGQRLLEEYSL